jgi:hypothetical protein
MELNIYWMNNEMQFFDKELSPKGVNRVRSKSITMFDRLCGLVVRVLGYRSGGPGSIPGTTRKKSSGSGRGSTQPREYN